MLSRQKRGFFVCLSKTNNSFQTDDQAKKENRMLPQVNFFQIIAE